MIVAATSMYVLAFCALPGFAGGAAALPLDGAPLLGGMSATCRVDTTLN